jgi:hypothetical protein
MNMVRSLFMKVTHLQRTLNSILQLASGRTNWILVPGAKGEAAGKESGSGGVGISFRES